MPVTGPSVFVALDRQIADAIDAGDLAPLHHRQASDCSLSQPTRSQGWGGFDP